MHLAASTRCYRCGGRRQRLGRGGHRPCRILEDPHAVSAGLRDRAGPCRASGQGRPLVEHVKLQMPKLTHRGFDQDPQEPPLSPSSSLLPPRFAADALETSQHPHGADPREVIRYAHQSTVMAGSSTVSAQGGGALQG